MKVKSQKLILEYEIYKSISNSIFFYVSPFTCFTQTEEKKLKD